MDEEASEADQPQLPTVDHLVVVRESDVSDRVLMKAMLDKTLVACADIRGADAVRSYGLDPLDNPDTYGGQAIRTRTHRMVLFAHRGAIYLYAMGSAAKSGPDSDLNDYVETLLDTIRTYRPKAVTLANMSRLLRSTDRAGALKAALEEVGAVLRVDGGLTINVREPAGAMLYMLLITFASFERDHIVMRMTAGVVAMAERGGTPFQASDLPLGYIFRDGKVVPDPSRVSDVRTMMTVLALDVTAREKAAALSAAGIRLPRKYATGTGDPGDSRDPKSLIRGIGRWLDLYETGVYLSRRDNPFPGLDRIGTAPVIREREEDRGYIELAFQWGLPEGGWAEPELIAAARAGHPARATPKSGGHAHAHRKPLLGLARWSEPDGSQWVLDSHSKEDYRLRTRTAAEAQANKGWAEVSVDGQLVARINAAALHKSIARRVCDALSGGVPARIRAGLTGVLVTNGLASPEPDQARAALQLQITRLRKKAARARQLAIGMDDPEDAAPWTADALASERQARKLQKRLSDLEDNPAPAAPPAEIAVNVAWLARAIAVLSRIDTDAPRSVGDALGQVLQDLRLRPSGQDRVDWTVTVVLPTPTGTVHLGPITGSVRTVAPRTPAMNSRLTTPKRVQLALAELAAGGSIPEVLAVVPEWGVAAALPRIRNALEQLGMPASTTSALLHAQIPHLRRTVVSAVLAKPRPSAGDVDQLVAALGDPHTDPRWIRHILTTYLAPQAVPYPRHWASSLGVSSGQKALDLLVDGGGSLPIQVLQEQMGGDLARSELVKVLLKDRIVGNLRIRACVERGNPWEVKSRHVRDGSRLQLIACPHCGGPELVKVNEASGC